MLKNFGVSEGLPSSECYWVMQDSRKFLWIATDAGVVKYDGYQFTTYDTRKGLPDNTVFKIHEDYKSRIWFSSFNGQMAYYDYLSDSIYTIPANASLIKQTSFTITDFYFDKYDTLWVSIYEKGLVKIYPPNYDILSVTAFTNNTYYIKTDAENNFLYGFYLKDKPPFLTYDIVTIRNGQEMFHVTLTKTLKGVKSVLSAIPTGTNSFLFSFYSSAYHITQMPGSGFASVSLKVPPIIGLYKDKAGCIWVNTRNGTFRYRDGYLQQPLDTFLIGQTVSSVMQDTDEGYWFTTTDKGLFYSPSLKYKYYNTYNGLTNDKINSIAIANNRVFICGNDGKLNILDLKTQRISSNKNGEYNHVSQMGDKILLEGLNYVLYDPATGKSQPVEGKNIKLNAAIKKMVNYTSDSLLSFNGKLILSIHKQTAQMQLRHQLPHRIFSICYFKNKIYVGTQAGLYVIEGGVIKPATENHSLLNIRIEDLCIVGDTLAIATRGKGVFLYHQEKIIEAIDETKNLIGNTVRCLVAENRTKLWVGTNKGISCIQFDKDKTFRCRSIDSYSGLLSNEINQLILHQGCLYMASNSGLGIIKQSDITFQERPVSVYLESLQVNGKAFFLSDTSEPLQLKPDENFITFSFKGQFLRKAKAISYKYRLEGLDTTWCYTKNTFVSYTTLPARKYRFVLYALTTNGILSEQPITLSFEIEKPFWKKLWFRILVIGVIVIGAYTFYTQRLKRVKQQEAEKTRLNKLVAESELKALRAQMNPHFIFNAINSIQSFILQNNTEEAHKYLTKFARLIRLVLENSKYELVPLKREMDALELYIELEVLRASFEFDYELTTEDALQAETLQVPPMLIQPFVENAILHGINPLKERRGKLSVHFQKQVNNTVLCTVDDNGIGRAAAFAIKQKKMLNTESMGLEVTKTRLDILRLNNQHLTTVTFFDKLQEGNALGTTVQLAIELIISDNQQP